MKWMQEHNKYENLTYLALWGMLFTVPVLSLYRGVYDLGKVGNIPDNLPAA